MARTNFATLCWLALDRASGWGSVRNQAVQAKFVPGVKVESTRMARLRPGDRKNSMQVRNYSHLAPSETGGLFSCFEWQRKKRQMPGRTITPMENCVQ